MKLRAKKREFMTSFFLSFFVYVEKGYKCYGLWRHKNMFYLFEKNNFYDGLNLELGSGRKITAKPVLSPNVQISEK